MNGNKILALNLLAILALSIKSIKTSVFGYN
jgi:hypothetical protein